MEVQPLIPRSVFLTVAPVVHHFVISLFQTDDEGANAEHTALVMNINPVDDNLVGYGQDFWTGEHEYGDWEHHFANDCKSPAAYQLDGPDRFNNDIPLALDGAIMIQSIAYPDRETDAAFEDVEIRGWRKWPALPEYPTFQSMFSTECCHGDNCGNGQHPCKTGNPSGEEVGSTDEWDDIIRRGNCLRTDLRYGSAEVV